MPLAHPVETSFNGRRAKVVEALRAKHKVNDCDLENGARGDLKTPRSAVLAVVNGDNFRCSTRAARFLALDREAMLRELGPGEIHEGAYASRSAKIGVGQQP